MHFKLTLLFSFILLQVGYTQQPVIDGHYLDSVFTAIRVVPPPKKDNKKGMGSSDAEYQKEVYKFKNGDKRFEYLWAESETGLLQIAKERGYPITAIEKDRFEKILLLLDHYEAGDHIQAQRGNELENQIAGLNEINQHLENIDQMRAEQIGELTGHYEVLRGKFDELNDVTRSSLELSQKLDTKLKKQKKWNYILGSALAAVLVTSILNLTSN